MLCNGIETTCIATCQSLFLSVAERKREDKHRENGDELGDIVWILDPGLWCVCEGVHVCDWMIGLHAVAPRAFIQVGGKLRGRNGLKGTKR